MVTWAWVSKWCAWCGTAYQPVGSRQKFCRPACELEQLDFAATAGWPTHGDGQHRTTELAPMRCPTCRARLWDIGEHVVCPTGCFELEADEVAAA